MKPSVFDFQMSLEDRYKSYIEELIIIRVDDFTIQLSIIKLFDEYTGCGIGKKILNDICDFADLHQYQVELVASSSYGVKPKSLYKFYTGFGFVRDSKKFERCPRGIKVII